MSNYAKLFSSILDSTVWETPLHVRVVWIAMMAMKDRRGVVEASVPGLAKRAGVTREQAEEALSCFLSPDPDSRSKEFEGRRIEEVDGGWILLNHSKYRDKQSIADIREKTAARVRRHREHKVSTDPKCNVTCNGEALHVTAVTPSDQIRSDQIKADQRSDPPYPPGGGTGEEPSQATRQQRAPLSGGHALDFDLALGEAAEALSWTPKPAIGHTMRGQIMVRCQDYARSAGLTFLEACRVIARDGLSLARLTTKSPAAAMLEVEPGKVPSGRPGGKRLAPSRATTAADFADAEPIEVQLERMGRLQ